MARQSTAPIQFNRSVRSDSTVLMTSGRAGVVIPVGYIPLLRGDSCAGRVSFDLRLAEMPRPLLNATFLNAQAWFVPKASHPQFSGMDEFYASYVGEEMPALGGAPRTPPPFFQTSVNSAINQSDFLKVMGLHLEANKNFNADIVDAFNLIYNFRLAAHSSKLTRRPYATEDMATALKFPRAFWPTSRLSKIVPDYERALVVGQLDLDVVQGIVPGRNLAVKTTSPVQSGASDWVAADSDALTEPPINAGTNMYDVAMAEFMTTEGVFADFAGKYGASSQITTSLADIDKARTTQAFAKLRTSMAGMDSSGFINDDTILAHLMQGLSVPSEMFKRPWLLDAKRVPFGFAERFSTDADALDTSVVTGRTAVELSLNVPSNDVGGMVMFTIEVLPEQLHERQLDEYHHILSPESLPNALRDIQNPEPVDIVYNSRIDARHTAPTALYGYEPLNDRWNRVFTRLGGSFYQATPGAPVTEQRMGVWQADVVDPAFTADHWLAPDPFPHYVFSDTAASAFEATVRHSVKIVGLTQIGDALVENNDDYAAVAAEGGA